MSATCRPRTARCGPTRISPCPGRSTARPRKRLTDIAKAVKDADGLILATDPDREGEAISWHVLEVLKQKRALKDKPVSRVVFNAITKQSVLDAMANPRQIDAPLVDAYLARRALDYLVGFTLSPVLWRKLPGARSAGRVQSVALRLVCDREAEIERFVREEYWQIAALLRTPRSDKFEARLTGFDGKRLQKLDISNKAQADDIKAMLEGATFTRRSRSRPSPPSAIPARPSPPRRCSRRPRRKLGFSATRTMQVAQRLYEGVDIGGETAGLITYMRTDGVQMAPEALAAARDAIGKRVRRALPAGEAALLFDQGQERAGSARGDPPDRLLRARRPGAQVSRCRPGAALRADLEARHRQPDAAGRDRAHHGRDRRRQRRAARPACAPSARSSASTASSPPTPTRRTTTPRTRRTAACRKSAPARRCSARRSTPPSTRPSRRRAIRKRR